MKELAQRDGAQVFEKGISWVGKWVGKWATVWGRGEICIHFKGTEKEFAIAVFGGDPLRTGRPWEQLVGPPYTHATGFWAAGSWLGTLLAASPAVILVASRMQFTSEAINRPALDSES